MVSDTGNVEDASRKLLRRVLWALLVFVGSIALFVTFLYGKNRSHEYHAATPTTATITYCWTGRSGVNCSGTWDVGGKQYRGTIDGIDRVQPPGSPVSVRADSVRAFAMTSTSSFYQLALVVSVFLVVAASALLIWG